MHAFIKFIEVLMPLITACISFVLVGVLGNFLVQKWQQRNWMEQQRLLRAEKRLDELKSLSDELMRLGDSRSYKTRRLLLNLESLNSTTLDSSEYLADYKNAVGSWNDTFNSLCTRLALHANTSLSSRLESWIQPKFYKISESLDMLVRVRRQNGPVPLQIKSSLNEQLDAINASLGNFYREILRLLLRMQKEAYVGREVKFSSATIQHFSTWYLLKAIFEADHPPATIFGPPGDFR